jgi:hypothetical protein
MLGYRVLKRFFSPNFGQVGAETQENRHQATSYPVNDPDRSNVIEDVDYEEVE